MGDPEFKNELSQRDFSCLPSSTFLFSCHLLFFLAYIPPLPLTQPWRFIDNSAACLMRFRAQRGSCVIACKQEQYTFFLHAVHTHTQRRRCIATNVNAHWHPSTYLLFIFSPSLTFASPLILYHPGFPIASRVTCLTRARTHNIRTFLITYSHVSVNALKIQKFGVPSLIPDFHTI